MKRKILTSLFTLLMLTGATGCSLFSSDKKDDQETAEVSDEGAAENVVDTATEEGAVATEGTTAEGDDLFADEGSASTATPGEDSNFPDAPMGADTTDVATTTTDQPIMDSGDSSASSTNISAQDVASAAGEENSSSITADTVASAATDSGAEIAPAPKVSLKKVESAPFERGGDLLNRVYIAREGDTLQSIGEKVLGGDHTKEMKKWNPYYASRKLKVGDKIYYKSAKSPDDTNMLTYYEDNGVAASSYISQEGESIRELGKKLLGNSRSWMELYATNPAIESKGELPAGTEIRYWLGDAGGVPPMASNDTAPPPPPAMDNGVPPMDPLAQNGVPPTTDGMVPPPPEGSAPPIEDPLAANAPPPPPPMDMSAPPPPPPPAPMHSDTSPESFSEESAMDDQNTMYLMIGLGVVVMLVLFFIIRKRKAREIDMGQTHV